MQSFNEGDMVQFDLSGRRAAGEVVRDNEVTVQVRMLVQPLRTWRGHRAMVKRHKLKHRVRSLERGRKAGSS